MMPVHTLDNYWILETRSVGYAFGPNDTGLLTHCYWGRRLPQPADYPPPISPNAWASFNGAAQLTPEEYPGYGGTKYIEPCLKVTFADGVRDFVPRFESATVKASDDSQLDVHLQDAHYQLRVTLHYRAHEAQALG
jgi:alpha-galactosidase